MQCTIDILINTYPVYSSILSFDYMVIDNGYYKIALILSNLINNNRLLGTYII